MAKRRNRRPQIPAELRRRVLVEAGHRCAIPTCRAIIVDVHHIIPYERVKKHEYRNLIALCPTCHRRATMGEIDRKSLRMYKANLRFAFEKYSQFEMDMLFALARSESGKAAPFPRHMLLLITRLLDSQFVNFTECAGRIELLGINMNPVLLTITEKGEEFVRSLNKKSIGY